MTPIDFFIEEVYTREGVQKIPNKERLLFEIQNEGDIASFADIPKFQETAKELDVRFDIKGVCDNSATSAGYQMLDDSLKHISHLDKLQELTLSRLPIDGTGLECLSSLPEFEVLRIYSSPLKSNAFLCMSGLPHLKRIIVTVRQLPTLTCNPNLSVLQKNKLLEMIDFTGCNFSDVSFDHFGPFPLLESVDLNGNLLRGENFTWISDCPSLKSLRLSRNPVTTAGIEVIAQNVKRKFGDLELADCRNANDEWIKSLSKINHLKCLYLDNGNITDKSLTYFQNMQALEFLSLEGCPISLKACKAIHAVCDKLTIRLPNGECLDSKKQKRLEKKYR